MDELRAISSENGLLMQSTWCKNNTIPEGFGRHSSGESNSVRFKKVHGNREQVSKQQRRAPRIHLGMPETSVPAISKKIHIRNGPYSTKSDQDNGFSTFAVPPLARDSSQLQLLGGIQKSGTAH